MRSLQFPVSVPVLVSCCLLTGLIQAEPRPVTRVTFYSPSVARELMFNIILPAGYEDRGKRYPVLYLLHGRNSNLDTWLAMGVPEYAVPYDLIIVMPDVGSSWYVNWAHSSGGERNDWEECITQDLIGFVDDHYRTVASRKGRAIDGFSMGGYGALTLSFLHPYLFCSVNSHSGALRFMDRLRAHLKGEGSDPLIVSPERSAQLLAEAEATNSLTGRTPQGRMVTTLAEIDAIDPFHLVLAVPQEQLPDIRLDCGLNENLFEYSRKFAELLMEHKIPFTYAQAPGRHDMENWSRAVQQSMAHQYAVMMKQLGGELPDNSEKSE